MGTRTNFYLPWSGKSLRFVSSDSSEDENDSESWEEESKAKKELEEVEVLYDAWMHNREYIRLCQSLELEGATNIASIEEDDENKNNNRLLISK